ncbi:hypothetical protein, partial [Corynebacterium singulare]|uniref:hypothetical protein n=1 Tax=Corynebacterium singulare TaxID=161899 RepID=UPI0011AA739C
MKKFNKTLSIALAVGLSVGGVTVPVGDTGNSFGFGVASASAAELDKSVVTKTELVSDKSGKNVLGTTVEATQEAYENFFNTHGKNYKLKLDFKIPDSAKPGDKFVVEKTGDGDFLTRGVIQAPTPEGRKVGSLDVGSEAATFTVSKEVGNAKDRTASFEVPFKFYDLFPSYRTSEQAQDGKPASSVFVKFNSRLGSSVEFKRIYRYNSLKTYASHKKVDNPNSYVGFERVDLNIGLVGRNPSLSIGHSNVILQDKGVRCEFLVPVFWGLGTVVFRVVGTGPRGASAR